MAVQKRMHLRKCLSILHSPHPGRLREALACYLIDIAGSGILQPLCSSFVSAFTGKRSRSGDFWFDSFFVSMLKFPSIN